MFGDSLRGRRVLVTGAGGFIGSHLVQALLDHGANVRALVRYNSRADVGWLREVVLPKSSADNAPLEVVFGDVTDPFATEAALEGCSLVFHLAALIGIPYSYVAPASYVAVNVSGTLNVLEACRKHGIERLIHTSTSETYGTADYTPIDERHPLRGQSPYSASKIAADQMVQSYWRSFALPVVIVRPFNTYGPRQSLRAVIPTILAQVLKALQSKPDNGSVSIRLGSLDPVRDYTFVGDTVRGFLAAAIAPEKSAQGDSNLGEVFNLGTGRGYSVREIVEMSERLLGIEIQPEIDGERLRPERSEVWELIASSERAAARLGWTPEIDLESGLKTTADWLKGKLGELTPTNYVI